MNQIDWMEIQIGGNLRQYDLFSNGTIFNEDPEDGVNFERIKINEFGAYTQIAKTFAESLKLTALIRYDKNENFDGQFTPRIAAVYTLVKIIISGHHSRPGSEIRIHKPSSFTSLLPVEPCRKRESKCRALWHSQRRCIYANLLQ